MLADPLHDPLSITAIAYAAGFGDLSHFNHSFRRRYGVPPREVRRMPQRGMRGGFDVSRVYVKPPDGGSYPTGLTVEEMSRCLFETTSSLVIHLSHDAR
jgi:hypothetical protein